MTTTPAPVTNESAEAAIKLAKRTVCLHLSLRALGTNSTLNSTASRVRILKTSLAMPELDAVNEVDGEIRAWIRKRSVTPEFISGGYYLISTAMIDEVDEKLREFVARREELVQAFYERFRDHRAAVLEEQRQKIVASATEAGIARDDLFDEADYPTADEARAEFKVYQRYFAFDVPTSLKAVSAEMYQREVQKQSAMWAEAHNEIQAALRSEFQKLVNHMADRLAVVDGKPRVFKDTLVSNFSEFLGTFPFRNVTDDAELQKLVGRARTLLSNVQPDDLRSNLPLRASAEAAFVKIRAELDTLVAEAPSRAITFET